MVVLIPPLVLPVVSTVVLPLVVVLVIVLHDKASLFIVLIVLQVRFPFVDYKPVKFLAILPLKEKDAPLPAVLRARNTSPKLPPFN